MCGRYALSTDQRQLEGYFHHKVPAAAYRGPNYNVSPTQFVPVLTALGFVDMRWGLVPQWAKSANTGYTMINARAETIMEKPAYKGSLKSKRCLVPATGFYEWQDTAQGKVPHYFHVKSRPLFGFAGLYVERHDAENQLLQSFTIVTTAANDVVRPVHDRMPVILAAQDESDWLNPDLTDPASVMSFLVPYDPSDMDQYVVSKDVSNARHNEPYLTQPQSPASASDTDKNGLDSS